jgi:hypothetical protein
MMYAIPCQHKGFSLPRAALWSLFRAVWAWLTYMPRSKSPAPPQLACEGSEGGMPQPVLWWCPEALSCGVWQTSGEGEYKWQNGDVAVFPAPRDESNDQQGRPQQDWLERAKGKVNEQN